METYLWHDWWFAQRFQVFAVYIRVSPHSHRCVAKISHFSSGVILQVICVIKANSKRFPWKKYPLAPSLEIFHSFALTLLEIAFIIETMIESSKSGKSIGCSVAINNRLETSRHWWNLRPFLCGGLSAVAVHVNNAWSQIDSSSLSSPSTHWLPGLQAGAPLFPSSDWLCLEGSGGDGKSPAPFSHAVLAASAPYCSDLCVCCWHSTLGPLVNFSGDAAAQSCHLDTYYRPRLFWKVNLLHSCTPKVLFPVFYHFLFPRQSSHCDWQWCSVAAIPQPRLLLLLFPRCSTPRSLANPPTIPLFTVFFFVVFFFKILLVFFHTLTYGAGVGSTRRILNDPALRTEGALGVLSPRGLGGESAEAGHPV